jgi:hypothetical protein
MRLKIIKLIQTFFATLSCLVTAWFILAAIMYCFNNGLEIYVVTFVFGGFFLAIWTLLYNAMIKMEEGDK